MNSSQSRAKTEMCVLSIK